jgi:hypothetical protein
MKKKCPKCLGTGIMQDQRSLGENCWLLRDRAGLSLAVVAGRMGIDASYLSYLEAGKRDWSPELLASFKSSLYH